MAYGDIAYLAMACVVMAYQGMVYTVMAFIVIAYIGMAFLVASVEPEAVFKLQPVPWPS